VAVNNVVKGAARAWIDVMSQTVSTDTEEIQANVSDYLLFVGIQTNTVISLCIYIYIYIYIYLTIYANKSSISLSLHRAFCSLFN